MTEQFRQKREKKQSHQFSHFCCPSKRPSLAKLRFVSVTKPFLKGAQICAKNRPKKKPHYINEAFYTK
jgi:hypothetical protein